MIYVTIDFFVYSKEHDLVDLLSHVVKKDSTHPKRDSTELVKLQISMFPNTQVVGFLTCVTICNSTHILHIRSDVKCTSNLHVIEILKYMAV